MTDEDFDYLFERSSSLEPFRLHYARAESCYADYAKRTATRFSRPGAICECCRTTTNIRQVSAEWKIVYQNKTSTRSNWINLILAFFGHFKITRAVLYFFTKHAFCARCIRLMRIQNLALSPLRLLARLTAAIPLILSVVSLLFLLIVLGAGETNRKIIGSLLTAWLFAIISIPVFSWGRRMVDYYTIPKHFRPISKSPVRFDGLSM
jgi:hypothetical protein